MDKLTNHTSAAYQEAVAIIAAGRDLLAKRPEADMPGFQPCATDQWRQEKYLSRQALEARSRESIRAGRKTYDAP